MSNKLGIIVEDKFYQYIHLPFGLKNATRNFCRTMTHVLAGCNEGVCTYVDDILVYTKFPDFSDHLQVLSKVFQRFLGARPSLVFNLTRLGNSRKRNSSQFTRVRFCNVSPLFW